MKRLLLTILISLSFFTAAEAGMDWRCYQDCTKQYSYQYCKQECSYESRSPSPPPTYTTPDFMGWINSYEAGRRAGQERELREQQLELQRQQNGGAERQVQIIEERRKAFEHFEANVKPEIVKVHPDFDYIVKMDYYWQWVEEQRPALKFAATESPDPVDITWAISEFKHHMAERLGIKEPVTFGPDQEPAK